MPTAQKCCKKQCRIKIFVWSDEKMHSCPQANQNTQFAKKTSKITKNDSFEEVPTAPKCCKKQYEIKIFFSHDQHVTKNVPHARRANHDKELTKTAKNSKKTFSRNAHGAEVL